MIVCKKVCKIVNVAVTTDHRMKMKDNETNGKIAGTSIGNYVVVENEGVSIITDALGPENVNLKKLEIRRRRIKYFQITAMLTPERRSRKVLDI